MTNRADQNWPADGKRATLSFNGKKFARNADEFTESLFDASGTCDGYYKVLASGILFSDHQNKPFAFLCTNGYPSRSGGFFVTCTRESNGRLRYMYGLCDLDAPLLGMPLGLERTRRYEREIAVNILNQVTRAEESNS